MQTLTSTPTLTWLPITHAVRARYLACAAANPTRSADYAFSNLYLWDDRYHQSVAFWGDLAMVRFANGDGTHRYLFPIGAGELAPMLELLRAEAAAEGVPLLLVCVTEPQKEQLLAVCPDCAAEQTRAYFDYLYTATSLATLAGKKLHGKRNHVNAFSAAHAWTVRALTPTDFDTCRRIVAEWDAAREGESVNAERDAILRCFGAFTELELLGALLEADGHPVAFTVGTKNSPDTFCVHFEKTLPAWESAYPVINRAFVRTVLERHPEIVYINREDDMGLENLRASKLSYRPAELLVKYAVRVR